MEDKRTKGRKKKKNFRKGKKEVVEEPEVEPEHIEEEEVIEEDEEQQEQEDQEEAYKRELIETIVTELELSEGDVLEEYEQFFKEYPDGEITKARFMQEHKVWL